MSLAQRIKDARLAKHYTQKDLAELLKVKSTTISGWELGRNEPSIESLKMLAKKLDVGFNYLAGAQPSEKYSSDLDDMLDNAESFDGKPMTQHDREVIKAYLEGHFGK